jgi:Fe-S cluster assembly iron-binding protein IscA
MVLKLSTHEDGGELLALGIEVAGSSERAYTYGIYLQAVGDARPEDWTIERGGLTLVVPTNSVDKIRSSVIDINPHSDGGEMVIENPNLSPRSVGDHTVFAKAQSSDSIPLIKVMTEPDAYPPVTLWKETMNSSSALLKSNARSASRADHRG